MSGSILVSPKRSFIDANGDPIAVGSVDVYAAGTTSRANSWQDRALTTLNTNPIILDSRGECLLWGDPAQIYKWVVKNAAGVVQYTVDNVMGSAVDISVPINTVDVFSGTGAPVAYTLSVVPASKDETAVFVSGVYQPKTSYTIATDQITISAAIGVNNIEVVTTSIADISGTLANMAAFADAASASATAAATSSTSASGFATAALGYKDQAAAIAAAIGAGGSNLERSQSFTGAGPWTVTGTPFASVTKVFIDGRLFRLNNFSLTNSGKTVTALVTINGMSLVDIYYI